MSGAAGRVFPSGALARTRRRTSATARRLTHTEEQSLELEDIQGNVIRGYKMNFGAFVFLRSADAANARSALKALEVTTEEPGRWGDAKPSSTLNLAFSASGLQALEVPETAMESFPPEFLSGMRSRAERLGDIGPNAPTRWEGEPWGGLHVLVMLHAQTADDRTAAVDKVLDAVTASDGGLQLVGEPQLTQVLEGEREHFGFTDGFSQPVIQGRDLRPGEGVPDGHGGWRPIRAGEIVLGYRDEDGALPVAPVAPYGVNGTFMVYRKLEQDVTRFRQSVQEQADALEIPYERLAAKVVGRWQDGSPLMLTPERPDPVIGNDSRLSGAYTYAADPKGYACPLGAHVRRANPRDGLEGGSDRTKRHRIMRRGMPYQDGERRGLIFICFNASITRQFEVVQNWLLDGNLFGVGEESDFLLGRTNDRYARMTIHGAPPRYITAQHPFVTTRGGEYLFVPGVRALQAILEPDTLAPNPERIPIADPASGGPLPPASPLGRRLARLSGSILLATPVLALLRRRRPIVRIGGVTYVTTYDDVRDVLTRHEDFEVPYLLRMEAMTGPFILGFPDGPAYQNERSALAEAIKRDDLERVFSVSAARAELALDGDGSVVDVLSDVTHPAIAAAIEEVFGIPFPDSVALASWSRSVFWEVFINALQDPRVTRRAERDADAMRSHIWSCIERRRTGPRRDDVLGRLLAQPGVWDDQERLRDSLFGLIVAWSVSVSRTVALAIHELMRHPDGLAAGERAARSGDRTGVTAALVEALRFRPQSEALPRRCVRDTAIAAGTPHETEVREGDVVVLVTKSAMRDGSSVFLAVPVLHRASRRRLPPFRVRAAPLLRRAHRSRPGRRDRHGSSGAGDPPGGPTGAERTFPGQAPREAHRTGRAGGAACIRGTVGIHQFRDVRALLDSIWPSRERHASGRLTKAMRDNRKPIPSPGHGAARALLPHTAIARRSVQRLRMRAG